MEALHDWHEFYFMLGSSSAALVALLFVAISVGIGFFDSSNAGATRTFISSIVVHFTEVLFISALALVPASHAPTLLTSVMICAGIVGSMVALASSINIFRQPSTLGVEIIDYFAYGFIPLVAYLKIIAAGFALAQHWEWAPELLATGVLLLLTINIRNAWDTVLTVVRRQTTREKQRRKK